MRLPWILAAVACPAIAGAAEVSLEFAGPKSRGEVVYAIFDSEAAWRARAPARLSGGLPEGKLTFETDLPPGRYAVMAFYDRNGDKKLNTLPIGLPTEPYAFSNNSRGSFGPPSWSAAAFTLTPAGVRQTIRLK